MDYSGFVDPKNYFFGLILVKRSCLFFLLQYQQNTASLATKMSAHYGRSTIIERPFDYSG